jgi:hypothetical protein
MHHVRAMQCFFFEGSWEVAWANNATAYNQTKLFVQATTILDQFLYQKWSGMESKQYIFSIMQQVRAMHCFLSVRGSFEVASR